MTVKPQHERVVVHVADDGMAAWASVSAGGVAGRADLDAALARAGVTAGLDEAACATLADALADPRLSCARYELAHGQPPVPGHDGFFEPAFHVGIQPGHLRADGKMDFYDRELLKPAAIGQALGWIRAATAGSDGFTVAGRRLPALPVRDAVLRVGDGVRAEADGTIVATRGGVVVYVDGRSLEVSPQLVHNGDVDLKSGALQTGGSLTVRGNVLPSFSVRAGGDVIVDGSIDGGSVQAGGNVLVQGGILGGASGAVSAEGNLVARHADRARLKAGGGITLESATHCEASADTITVARLRGGSARAQRSVVAHDAGAPRGGTSTELAAGIPTASIEAVVRAANAQKDRRTAERRGGSGRSDSIRPKGGKIGLASAAQEREAVQEKLRHAELRERLVARAFVEVGGTAHAGTMIVLGEHHLLLERDVNEVRFSLDRELGRIRQSPK